MSNQTRADSCIYTFGSANDILLEQTSILPTYDDVIRYFQSIRVELTCYRKKQPVCRDVANIVAIKRETLWKKSSIPTVMHKGVIDMILQYKVKYQMIIKPFKDRKTTFFIEKLRTFKNEVNWLFDICSCKCENRMQV